MNPTSLPVIPAAPSTPAYGIADLDLFKTYTRASFLASVGEQAPPYDPTQRTRTWFDTSASPGPYVAIDPGTGQSVSLAVPKNVALPNLAGAYEYPEWNNPPTTVAELNFGGGLPSPGTLPAAELCSAQDAEAVKDACPVGTTVGEDPTDASSINWGSETRRRYTVNVPNGPQGVYAAILRAEMTAIHRDPSGGYISGGVGSPGSFQLQGGSLVWVPLPDPGLSASGAMLVPTRPLLAGESIQPGIMGVMQIVNANNGGGAASQGGGLTPQQAQAIAQIPGMASILNQLAQRFGISS